jgi:uncharacterized alkaline shock family protein YloU
MRIVNIVVMVLYTVIFFAMGGVLLLVAVYPDAKDFLTGVVEKTYMNTNWRIVAGIAGIVLVLIGISVIQMLVARYQREKNIAFNNPNGQVSISLMAVEDFIRRVGDQIRDVKELKSDVVAGRKGVEISCRVTLWADSNIPEATEKIQGVIKSRIQEMLGIEEAIVVKVHVTKIVPRPEQKKKTQEPQIPYRGLDYGT